MNAIQLFIVVQVRSLLAHCPKNNLNICIQSASLYTGWEQMQRNLSGFWARYCI